MIPECSVRQSQQFGGAFLLTAALFQGLAHQTGSDHAQMLFKVDALFRKTRVVKASRVFANSSQVLGQAPRGDELGGFEGNGPLDDVLEFANVAGPGVGLEDANSIGGQPLFLDPEATAGPLNEVASEIGKIGGSLAQRWQVEVEEQ